MIKSIHIFLTSALLICSTAFGLDNSVQEKNSEQAMIVKKDIALDKKSVGKNPRLEKAEKIAAAKQNRVQFLMPGGRTVPNSKVIDRLGIDAFDVDETDIVRLPKKDRKTNPTENISRDELWNVSYVNEGDAYYYLGSGSAGDTLATVFTPAAPCVVTEVYAQFYTAGNYTAFGADYGTARNIPGAEMGDAWNVPRGSAYYFADPAQTGPEDTLWASAIGAMRTTETPNTVTGSNFDWASHQVDIGGTFEVGDPTDLSAVDQFVIGIVKGGDTPNILAASTSDIGATSTYTWFSGPWTDGQWGAYSSVIEQMMLVKVTYPWGAPIAVASMTQPSNTYEVAGTRTIEVDLFDDEQDGSAINEDDTLRYYYTAGGATETGYLTASAAAANGNGIYTFDITYSLSAGDSVTYWVDLKDNDGLESQSAVQQFNITSPLSPAADVLVVIDNADVDQESVLYDAMDNTGLVYEVWNIQEEKGIDASVINHGWTNIIVSGWGVSSVPATTQADPGYKDFVVAGNNLVLMDMDLFYGHGLDAEPVFVEGDFMYDVFGLSGGWNDPMDDLDEGSLHGDTLTVYGADVTTLDSPWTDGYDQNHTILATAGWTDVLVAGDAEEIFYDEDDNVVGSSMTHEAGGTATYLSFMPEAGVDWHIEEGDTLGWDISHVELFFDGMLDYLEAVSPPMVYVDGTSSTRFGVASGTATATINGSAADGDGTIATIHAVYDIDGTQYETPMTDNGDGTYSATVDLTGWTDASNCTYWVSATDNDGLNQTSGYGYFWGTTHVPSDAGVLLMSDLYEPYGANGAYGDLGPSQADTLVNNNLTATGTSYDTWSVYNNYQPDFGSVLSNYDAVIYHGVFDWIENPADAEVHPLTEFVDNGGFLLYSSEEAIGTYTGWEDMSIPSGHFVHDVLGVEWVMHDIGYTTVKVKDDLALTNGMSPDDTLDVPGSFSNWGSMADIVDPLGWGTPDQLHSPFHTADTLLPDWTGGMYDVSTKHGNVAFMAFNLSFLPDTVQQALMTNFMHWANGDLSNEEDVVSVPQEFALYQNYPNPFNPETNIMFDIPEVSNVNITVFNVLGKEVNSIDFKSMRPGQHNISWKGTDRTGKAVSSGVYFYTIQAGDFVATKKMMFLK